MIADSVRYIIIDVLLTCIMIRQRWNILLVRMYMDACLYVPLLDYPCRNSDLLLTIMQVNGTVNLALLLDQIVDYTCATNARGQYCSVALLDNIADVCAKSVAFLLI